MYLKVGPSGPWGPRPQQLPNSPKSQPYQNIVRLSNLWFILRLKIKNQTKRGDKNWLETQQPSHQSDYLPITLHPFPHPSIVPAILKQLKHPVNLACYQQLNQQWLYGPRYWQETFLWCEAGVRIFREGHEISSLRKLLDSLLSYLVLFVAVEQRKCPVLWFFLLFFGKGFGYLSVSIS